MSILVTRPSPAGEQLVNRLRASGQRAFHAPLIRFAQGKELSWLSHLFPSLQAGDCIFLLSQQAVYYVNRWLNENKKPWPGGVLWYAIGHKTALAFHAVSGLQAAFPLIQETSEMLLMLPELYRMDGKKALILRGNGGRELLGETLSNRGAKVILCECYLRHFVNYNGYQQSMIWQQLGIDTLVVTSGEMLQQLRRLVPDDWRTTWLLGCQLIVVSHRLAGLARQLGWQVIRVAENADNDALIRALR